MHFTRAASVAEKIVLHRQQQESPMAFPRPFEQVEKQFHLPPTHLDFPHPPNFPFNFVAVATRAARWLKILLSASVRGYC